MSAMIIRNARVIDPANKRDEVGDVYISDGKIVASKSEIRNPKSKILNSGTDAGNCTLEARAPRNHKSEILNYKFRPRVPHS